MAENNFEKFLNSLSEVKKLNQDYVVITLVNVIGSAPADSGARAIITKEGLYSGTVGGGKVEHQCINTAKELLESKNNNAYFEWNLQKDVGMTCGGVVKYFFEVFRTESSMNITVFGAGHVSQELCRMLLKLDCKITCIDPRAEWIDKLPIDPKLNKIKQANPYELVQDLPNDSFVILMTMGHATDFPILKEALLKKEFPYLGVIGSKAKANVLKKELKASGVDAQLANKFICPIGESFGNNSPAEIAISIIAQLLKFRDSQLLV